MISAGRLPIWFPEPLNDDPTYARRGESTIDWLRRSTVARARDSRRFMNENVNALPAVWRPILVRDLETRWKSAFFELIVARTLQVLGASLVIEPESLSTTRIDFRATFPEGTVNVEAVALYSMGTWDKPCAIRLLCSTSSKLLRPQSAALSSWSYRRSASAIPSGSFATR